MPGDDAAALDWLLFTQAGVVSWAQATAELTPSRVRHLLATGRWERVCRGILRAGGGPVTVD
ncbi:type IV toxin-antitoxin system AbiEi family antitoxin domain-containing protein [Micromonospora sp. HM134]|uniref:type IV toxin-antitoxin system AbiEi family antitoxin domain-containing protein n=2 Tax=unclassified Micromonospora TaxID=2617518 RepID=UPI001F0FED05|nr:type IV toxin-antitoxin system AbiEi family antitoxin domain-containing protein [Micromonospora sp. HM134]